MKKVILFSLLFIFNLSFCLGQKSNSTKNFSLSDSLSAKDFLEEARHIANTTGDYKLAIEKAKKAKLIYQAIFPKEHINNIESHATLGQLFQYSNQIDSAIFYLKPVIEIRSQEKQILKNVGLANITLGNCYLALGKNSLAEKFLNTGIEIVKTVNDSTLIGEGIGSLSALFYLSGDYIKAAKLGERSIKILLDQDEISHTSLASAYNITGTCHCSEGSYQKGSDYLEEALRIDIRTLGEFHPYVAYTHNNLGVCLRKARAYKRAIYHLKLAARISEENNMSIHPIAYDNIGVNYGYLKEYKNARDYHLKAKKITSESLGDENPEMVGILGNIAEVYYFEKQYKKSIEWHIKAINLARKVLPLKNATTINLYNNLGRVYLELDSFEQSINFVETALDLNLKLEDEISKFYSVEYLFHSLKYLAKAHFKKFKHSKDYKHLEEALYYFSELDGILANRKNDLTIYKESLIDQLDQTHYIYQSYLEAILFENQSEESISKAFSLSEKAKSLILLGAFLETNSFENAYLPDSLRDIEQILRSKISKSEKKLFHLGNKQESAKLDSIKRDIEKIIFTSNQEYDLLIKNMKEYYPEYYNFRYNSTSLNTSQASNILNDSQALLEYFVGDSSIFIFRIEKDKYEVKEVKRDFPLEEWVQQLRDNISQPMPFAYEAYLEVAPKLYEKLIAPVAEGLPEKLVIVPDGILGYIPFEALLKEEPDARNLYAAGQLPYLLREHQVSYCYSATLLREMKEKKHQKIPKREMLAVAPFTTVDTVLSSHLDQSDWLASTRSDTLVGLPYSKAEVDSIQKIFKADAFYGAEANEAAFVDRAGDYRILHLSTHGKADARVGDYSYLAFYPQPDSVENELLYVRDLYNLQLNADLVVLSACETGTGELQRGEGIISLARAFAYAGAKSIATTLWQVNDKSTQELMVSFYQHLKSGMTKDAALRQAKLDFLDGHRDTAAYPFYWAAFIGVGDMQRLN